MSTGPFRVKGAKATLLVSLGMTMLGFWGVLGSTYRLTLRSDDPVVARAYIPREAATDIEPFVELLAATHLDEAVVVANLLVSVLLIIGSFALSARRRTALWWVRQALLANVLYTVVGTAVEVALFAMLTTPMAALPPPASMAQYPDITGADVASAWLIFTSVVLVIRGTVLAALYLGLLRVSGRESVRDFITPPT